MSINGLPHIGKDSGLKGIVKTKAKENEKVKIGSASSLDYHVILRLTCLSVGIVLSLFMIVQTVMTSHYGSPTIDDVSKCTKVMDIEQTGHYTSQAQFKVAESYCFIK